MQPAIVRVTVASLLLAAPLGAQARWTAVADSSPFRPLDLPAPSAVRTASGRPGAGYWQQRADYRIRATLDPSAHRVTGSETITYTNNSPGELEFLWIQLEQNLFRPGSRGALVNSGSRWRGAFPGGGVDLSRVEVVHSGTRYRPSTTIDDTRMRLDLETPLAGEGGTIDIEIDWSFVIPEYGADRMGRLEGADGWVYELAQWYPRMYVYDDVDGWNPLPYLGQGEFYLDYGTYDVEITVPRDVIVVAGGELLNPQDVLTAEQQRRMERARATRETVMIVSADEVGTAASRPSGSGALTWK